VKKYLAATAVILTLLAMAACKPRSEKHGAFGDGMWEIGTQMPTGHYQSRVPERTPDAERLYDCLWYIATSSSDPSESIVNGELPHYGKPGQVVEVDIDADDSQQVVFLTDGCGSWQRVR